MRFLKSLQQMRIQSRFHRWWLALIMGISLSGNAQAQSLDQQFFELQLVIDQIYLAHSVGDRIGVCTESRRANNLLLEILPALQRKRSSLDHAALQDSILLGLNQCR